MADEHRIARAYRHVFTGAEAREVLDDLRAQFYDVPVNKGTAHETAVAAGAHDVVRYILQTLEEARQSS